MPGDDLESQFRVWLAEYGGAVLKVARAYTASAEDCRDLAQEILLRVWRSLPRFRGEASPATWCYRVALNTALDWKRKEHRRRAVSASAVAVEYVVASKESDAPQQAAQREAVERLYGAIRQLPATDAALVLLDLEGLSDREIAEVLGITANHVGVKLNRARKRLGDLMGGDR